MPDKVLPLKAIENNVTITSNQKKVGARMTQDFYTKTEIDLKLDKISSEIKHSSEKSDLRFEQVDLKLDNLESKIENMFLTQEQKRLQEQRQNKKEFTYWAISIIVALLSIAIPVWLGK